MINNYFQEENEYHASNEIYLHPVFHNSVHLGDMSAALDVESLHRMNIKSVVTAAACMDHIQYEPDTQIKHFVYPLDDVKSENIAQHFNPVYQLIEKELENGSILIHCAAGVSRSATLVIAYLMKHKSWTFHEAIAFVRKNRPKVCPNLGFERQLKEYERFIFQKKRSSSLFRKVPKTSEESKHLSKKDRNIELPEIGCLGKTQIRNIVFDPFFEKRETRLSNRRKPEIKRPDEEDELPNKSKQFKVRKAKSIADKSENRPMREPLVANLILGAHSLCLNRLNIGEIKTQRMVRRKNPAKMLAKESYGL